MEYDDAVMEDVTLAGPNEGNQNQTPSANQDPLALASQESVSHIHIEGQAEIGIPATHLLPSTPDYASLSSSDTALLDGPNIFEASTPLPKVLKIEENPFSPNLLNLDDEMYPALPEPQEPSQYQQVIQLPHGRINVNGTYYIPVPPPHNEVVATSSVPTTSKVRLEAPTPTPRTSVESSSRPTTTDSQKSLEEPKAEKTFAKPEEPPFQKVERKSRKKSRSISKSRSKSRSQSRNRKTGSQQATTVTVVEVPNVRSGRGRGKRRPEMPSAPIVVPPTHSHLLQVPKPRSGSSGYLFARRSVAEGRNRYSAPGTIIH